MFEILRITYRNGIKHFIQLLNIKAFVSLIRKLTMQGFILQYDKIVQIKVSLMLHLIIIVNCQIIYAFLTKFFISLKGIRTHVPFHENRFCYVLAFW